MKDSLFRSRNRLLVFLCFVALLGAIFPGRVVASSGAKRLSGGAALVQSEIDLNDVIGVGELKALARAVSDKYYAGLSLQERSFVDRELRKLDAEEPGLQRAVLEITSTAAVVGGMRASEPVASIFSAEAVAARPDDALAVCNFGAVLHLLERLDDSVAVLKLARVLEPDSPVILTNLANSVYDLGDVDTARKLYLDAIDLDSTYGPARRSLGDLYLAAGDWRKALEQYLAAAEYGYTPGVKRGIGEATDAATEDGHSENLPPPPGTGSAGVGSTELSGARNGLSIFQVGEPAHPLAQLRIPNMPQWSDYVAFAKSSQELNELTVSVASQMGEVLAGYPVPDFGSTGGGRIGYDKQHTQQAYLERYYTDKLNELQERHGGLFTNITSNVLGSLEEELYRISETYQERILAIAMAGGSEEKIKQEMAKALKEWCEEQDAVHGKYYGEWLNKAKQYYAELRLLLEMYIRDSAPILTSIYDPASFKLADIDRQLFVLTEVQDLTLGWVGAATSFQGCLYPPCSHGADSVETDSLDNGSNKPSDCPFKDGSKLKLDLGIVTITIDCTTVGVDGGELIVGGFSWDFKEKRVAAVRLGVGGSLGGGVYREEAGRQGALGKKTGLAAGGSMGMGFEMTFDESGGLSDIRGQWDMGAQVTTPAGGYSPAVSLMAGTSGTGDASFGW